MTKLLIMKTDAFNWKNYFLDATHLIRLCFLLLLIVAPLTFAQSSWTGLGYGIGVGFLNGLLKKDNLLQAVFAGLTAGIIPTLFFSLSEGLLVGSLVAFAVGFTTTLSQVTEVNGKRIASATILGLLLGLTMSLSLLLARDFSEVFPIIIGMTTASALATPLGIFAGRWLRPKILIYESVWLYLREMADYLVLFALGYIALALLFAGWYWSLWKIDPSNSLNNLSPDTNFWEFFYFSFVTLATLGYGDITPKSEIARGLAILEVVVGTGWVIVIFAAIIANLQSKFSEIAANQLRQTEKDPSNMTKCG